MVDGCIARLGASSSWKVHADTLSKNSTPFVVAAPYEHVPESTLKATQAGERPALRAVLGGQLR